jgi:hypothetical protein
MLLGLAFLPTLWRPAVTNATAPWFRLTVNNLTSIRHCGYN